MNSPDLRTGALTVWPSDHQDLCRPEMLGGKAFNLSRLVLAGFPVPSWFAVSTAAFDEALSPAVRGAIQDRLETVDYRNLPLVAQVSLEINALIQGLEVPAAVREAILRDYERLGGDRGWVAVRSSALGEDSATQSFAGQLDTFLYVRGEEELLSALKGCWASAYSARSLSYRHLNGLDHAAVRVAVVVQEMVPGEVSGVLFTANPINGRRREAVLSATYGLGEGLVSGELDADNWVVDRQDHSLRPTIATKAERIVFDSGRGQGTHREAVETERQLLSSLSDAQILEVVALGDRLAAHFGAPQDIEWTLRDGAFVLLQTRPITALPSEPEGRSSLFDNSNVSENYAGVTTPLTFSFASRAYEISYSQLAEVMGFDPLDVRRYNPLFKNMIALIQGRIYYNLGNWYELMSHLPGYSFMRRFFALSIGATTSAGGPEEGKGSGLPQFARLLSRLTVNYLSWDSEIVRFERHFHEVYERIRRRPFATMPLDALAESYLELERDLIWSWTAPNVNDFFATLFYGLLRQLLITWKLDDGGSLQNDLLCGQGGLVSTEPTRAILSMAQLAFADAPLRALLEATPPSEIEAKLGATAAHATFHARVVDYLERYGYRCMGELRLESIPLTEDSGFLFVTLMNYLRAADREGAQVLEFAQIEAREARIRQDAEARVNTELRAHPLRRTILGWVLACARKAVRHRENTRFERTRAFGVVREIVRAAGCRLAEKGQLEAPRDVFYLTLDELLGWVQGRATCLDLKALTHLRKSEFAAFQDETPDDRFETLGPIYQDNLFHVPPERGNETPGELRGISCCPGTVKGRARVIRPGSDMRLNGEILVAERTDPGWIPLYPSASALLIERGSMLSHSAIVAREMGLPTIVGIAGLMQRVADGQYLELDAREGVVYLERQAANEA